MVLGDLVIEQRNRFLALLAASVSQQTVFRLVLAKYRGPDTDLIRIQARPVEIRGEQCLSFIYRYRTRDVTRNLPPDLALQLVDELLGSSFRNAHLLTGRQEIQLSISKRDRYLLRISELPGVDAGCSASPPRVESAADSEAWTPIGEVIGEVTAGRAHNREKRRMLPLDRPFLQALGVTDQQHRLVPSMSRKWKQINRFIEVFDGAWRFAALSAEVGTTTADAAPAAAQRKPIKLIDFGSGKGYLTFALHDYLRNTLGIRAEMTGVERRQDLVKLCNEVVASIGIEGLSFRRGDIKSYGEVAGRSDVDSGSARSSSFAASGLGLMSEIESARFDVMIALHACDTATDDAIHQGILCGAAIIMCAPCCHKQLRPQLLSPHPLRPILRHGVHLGQEAEMLTDGLRALLLEACGYDTQVFEFISLEHTSKNKMILAVKRAESSAAEPVLAQIREIKAFYGIREQRLEELIRAPGFLGRALNAGID